MKKCLLTLMAVALGMGVMNANPVSLSTAKTVGQQFVQTNFEPSRQSDDLALVYTGTSTRGEVCFYVFNVGKMGHVIVSADDYYRPVIAYSDEGVFDAENINPALRYMLDQVIANRSGKLTGKASPKVAAEWQSVMHSGSLLSLNGGKAAEYLVQTKWNQSPAPYNSMCPEDPQSPQSGYHAYVGCVATAMSQVMKYWNHPLQGQGTHSYYHPKYGQQSANYGATTYDWDNMLNAYSTNNYTPEQGDAVATLCYHCGVAVNMDYGGDIEEGSGASTEAVPGAISNYFRYATAASVYNKTNTSTWMNVLKEALDMRWPLYYAGVESGAPYGHAFICDGYNDNDYFHFNWGWGGSGDNWFLVDEITYNAQNKIISNFVPQEVYNTTAQAPTNLTVTPGANNALTATLTWTNPSKTLSNNNLTSIDQIVIMRGGEVAGVVENPAPGAATTFVDNEVPRFDSFVYQVYAVSNGNHGKTVYSDAVSFGPTCNWKMVVSSSEMIGWRGAYVSIYNAAGTVVRTVTTTSSNVSTIQMAIPLGRVSFGWTGPTNGTIADMTMIIKNSNDETVYSYTGPGADLAEGIFFETNNGCGNAAGTQVPSNLYALRDEDNVNDITVSWDGVTESGYGYNIYRDDLLFRTIPNATSFVDHNAPMGGHCYYATFLSYGGENPGVSNESCANAGDGCEPATNLDYEPTGAMHKVKLKWERPENTEGLSGFFVFRKSDLNPEWKRIKITGANASNYTDNSLNTEDHYYYKVYAYYQDTDCMSAPANWIWDTNQFYLHVYWSSTGVEENNSKLSLYPNPAKDSFTVEGEGLHHIEVYNMVGQKVYSTLCEGHSTVINLAGMETGIYMVKVFTTNDEIVRKVSVIR